LVYCTTTVVLSFHAPIVNGSAAFVPELRNIGMGSSDEGIENSATTHSLFVNNLEKWIDAIIMQNGLADKELIKTIKERYQRSIQANIEHHQFMMKNAKAINEPMLEQRHKLIAEIYSSLSS
jgi:hypothetical protein